MAPKTKGPTKKMLFFTKSSGFEHSVIAQKGASRPTPARSWPTSARSNGFEVVVSKDGRMFEPDQIGQWDVFVFETTGDLTVPGGDKEPPISADGEKAFYEAIRGGKGFIGHALRYRHLRPPRQAEQGSRGSLHPDDRRRVHHPRREQKARSQSPTPSFRESPPGSARKGNRSTIKDEWYALKHMPDDLHVILYQVTEGMTGKMYERPNFPMTWARAYGKGRRLLHLDGPPRRRLVEPEVPGTALGALAWASGRAEANIEPNLKQVTPKGNEFPT